MYLFYHRGKDLDGFNVGLAYLGGICHELLAVGITQDGLLSSDTSSGTTLAHELGHLLNMMHDDDRSM